MRTQGEDATVGTTYDVTVTAGTRPTLRYEVVQVEPGKARVLVSERTWARCSVDERRALVKAAHDALPSYSFERRPMVRASSLALTCAARSRATGTVSVPPPTSRLISPSSRAMPRTAASDTSQLRCTRR